MCSLSRLFSTFFDLQEFRSSAAGRLGPAAGEGHRTLCELWGGKVEGTIWRLRADIAGMFSEDMSGPGTFSWTCSCAGNLCRLH